MSYVPIISGKGLSRSFSQENGGICHKFFNFSSGGHRGQTMLPYDLHHDAPFWKAGSKGFSVVCIIIHIKLILRPKDLIYCFSLHKNMVFSYFEVVRGAIPTNKTPFWNPQEVPFQSPKKKFRKKDSFFVKGHVLVEHLEANFSENSGFFENLF